MPSRWGEKWRARGPVAVDRRSAGRIRANGGESVPFAHNGDARTGSGGQGIGGLTASLPAMGQRLLAALLVLVGVGCGAYTGEQGAGSAGAEDAAAGGAAGASQRSPDLPPFYHTTRSIIDAVAAMADPANERHCPGLSVVQASRQPAIPVVHLSRASPGTSRRRRRRLFFLFGEHARELISPETALRVIEDLCGWHEETRAQADTLLAFYDVRIVPVANPLGRARVEAGEFCRRTNEHDVDLNRNWPDHFQFQRPCPAPAAPPLPPA